jgi:hypothetical protein
VKRAYFLANILLLVSCGALARADPLAWVNAVRAAAGAPLVAADEVLSRTASRWASILADAGVLSHRGSDGSSALDRYRALGGTDARVGEILGAGPSLAAVEKGWMGSPEHRGLALSGTWTHVGWGSARARVARTGDAAPSSTEVWVMVFCQRLVEGLAISADADGLSVTGRFTADEALEGVLLCGLEPVAASDWDASTRRFRFSMPGPFTEGYYRLGYRTAGGGLVWTNSFTSPQGTGFPAGPARSAAPAPRP